jgi:hypothetical protein
MRTLRISLVILALASFALAQGQQDKSKRPSPPGQAQVTLGGKNITIDYSRPKIRDPKTGQPRQIMGNVVPYGKVWRTGANEATTLKTDADLDIGGTRVPAGTYTLFTVPEQDKWTLVISKKTGEWGTEYPGEANDLARVPMTVSKTNQTVDQFTISLNKQGDNQATLNLEWENTRASVPVNLAQ